MNKYVVEFLGTLFFLYVILATGQALAIGLALTVAIMVGGKISGGNFNPAVSVMMAAAVEAVGCCAATVLNPHPVYTRSSCPRSPRE